MVSIEDKVESLLREFNEKKLYLDQAVDYFKKENIQLSQEESLRLIEKMLEQNVFRWLHLIGYLLEKTASLDSRFLEVLFKAMEKPKGLLIQHLVQIGISQPELAIKIYEILKDKRPELLLQGCWILGGVGKVSFEKISEIVQEGILAPESEAKVASLVALRVSFGEKMESRWKDFVFSLLKKVRKDANGMVKRELVRAYVIFYDYCPEECFSCLKTLAEEEVDVRLELSDLLCSRRLLKEHHLALVKQLSSSQEDSVLNNISLSLAFQSELGDVDEGLGIIHEWLKRGKFYEINSLPLALNKLGNYNLALCLNQLETWVRDGNYKIKFLAPNVAVEFAQDNFKGLKDKLIIWMDCENLLAFSLETVRVLLHHIFERSNEGKNPSPIDKDAITDLLSKLKTVAQKQRIDPEKISKREKLDIYKCLALIEEIEEGYEELNYKTIWKNLGRFPNIQGFLGEKWFKQKEREQNKTHPLLRYMAVGLLDTKEFEQRTKEIEKLSDTQQRRRKLLHAFQSIECYALLSHLDQELESITDCTNVKEIKSKLREEESYWSAFSEIDVIARLKRAFRVQISPSLIVKKEGKPKVKKPDLDVAINDTQVYVEVISPEMFAPLKYFRFAGIPNRLRSKVIDEIEHHFRGMEIDRDILIVVDMGSSEVNYSSIQDYAEGPLQFVMRVDKKTGQVIDTFVKRGEPMTKMNGEVRQVIGIIGYRRIFSKTDGKIHLKGRTFLNPDVSDKEKEEILMKVTGSLLG